MNKFGDTIYVQTTDEPVKVIRQFKRFTLVRRPVMGQNGIRYLLGLFFNMELETLEEQTQRTLATIKIRNEAAEAQLGELANGPLAIPPGLHLKKPS